MVPWLDDDGELAGGEWPGRLTPAMASRRGQVLAFVRAYIRRMGISPSYSEIAHGVGTNKARVADALRALVRDGLLVRIGGPRGLALPEAQQEAIVRLRAAGFVVEPPGSDARGVTQSGAGGLPLLHYAEPGRKARRGG